MNSELVMMNGDSGLSPVTEPYEEQSPLPSEASLPSTISVPYMDARQDASQYVDQEQIFSTSAANASSRAAHDERIGVE